MGLEGLEFGLDHRFLLEGGRQEECRLVVVGHIGAVEIPAAVALGRIEQPAAVGVEAHRAFLLWGVGDAFGGAVLDGSDKDLAAGDKGDLLAIR